jgi:hypothetical protein
VTDPLTTDQHDALSSLGDFSNAPADPQKVTFRREQPQDPGRETVSLSALAKRTGLSIEDLYNRARGRGLLVSADRRTPSDHRLVYADQVDEVLAPKRGSSTPVRDLAAFFKEAPTPVQESPAPGGASPETVRVSNVEVGDRALIVKLIRLARQGQLQPDETLTLIEGVISK